VSDPTDMMQLGGVASGSAVLGIIVREAAAWLFKRKAREEDDTAESLKSINAKLDQLMVMVHGHDRDNAVTEAQLENLQREVVELRRVKHEMQSTISAHIARLELVEERLRDVREDTNPRGHQR